MGGGLIQRRAEGFGRGGGTTPPCCVSVSVAAEVGHGEHAAVGAVLGIGEGRRLACINCGRRRQGGFQDVFPLQLGDTRDRSVIRRSPRRRGRARLLGSVASVRVPCSVSRAKWTPFAFSTAQAWP